MVFDDLFGALIAAKGCWVKGTVHKENEEWVEGAIVLQCRKMEEGYKTFAIGIPKLVL